MQYKMEIMHRLISVIITLVISTIGFSQSQELNNALEEVNKGEYVILEVRMQLEDVFQTLEGNESANLSRIAIFTGKNKDREIVVRGFEGFNQVVKYFNEIEQMGFDLKSSYPIKGNSLLITHYVFRKIKR